MKIKGLLNDFRTNEYGDKWLIVNRSESNDKITLEYLLRDNEILNYWEVDYFVIRKGDFMKQKNNTSAIKIIELHNEYGGLLELYDVNENESQFTLYCDKLDTIYKSQYITKEYGVKLFDNKIIPKPYKKLIEENLNGFKITYKQIKKDDDKK